MEPSAAIGIFFDSLPLARRVWRWLYERRMEIEVFPPRCHPNGEFPITPDGMKPIFIVGAGAKPHIHMWIDLALTNHRTDRKERIVGCTLHLKKRRLWFWEDSIAQAKVYISNRDPSRNPERLLSNIDLEPLSGPTVLTVEADGPIDAPVSSLPKKMKLVLEFNMVGPMRRLNKVVEQVRHDPNRLVSDSGKPELSELEEPIGTEDGED